MNTDRIATRTTTHHTRIVARRLLTVAVAGVLSLPVTAAFAGFSASRPSHITVSYAPSSLANAEYAGQLYARISNAAMEVCGDADIRQNRHQQAVDACVAGSVARAVHDVASPELRAVHEEASGKAVRLAAVR